MLANLHDGSSIHRQYSPTYFNSVILFVLVYPLPLVMRYRNIYAVEVLLPPPLEGGVGDAAIPRRFS